MQASSHFAGVLGFLLAFGAAHAQTYLGAELRAGVVKPKSYAPYGSNSTDGSIGTTIDLRILLSDRIGTKLIMNYGVGYLQQWYIVRTRDGGLGGRTNEELDITSGWLVLGVAPGWAMSRDKRTTAELGIDLLIPILDNVTGYTRTSGPYGSSTLKYDNEPISYGRTNARIVFSAYQLLISKKPYVIRLGAGSGFGFTEESQAASSVLTWQAFVSISMMWKLSKKEP